MTRARRYTETQKAALRKLEILHEEYVLAKKELKARLEEEYAAKLSDYEYQESRLMNTALRTLNANGKGIAKTDIGRAVGLANWDVLKEKYELTADEFEEIIPDPWVIEILPGKVRLLRFLRFALDLTFTGSPDNVQVEGSDLLDAPALSADLENGLHADQWAVVYNQIKEALA